MDPLFVAELSCNHLGDFDRAVALVEVAADSGASAIKTQCYSAHQMANPGIIIREGPWAGRELLDLYQEAETPRAWHEKLFKRAQELGMVGFASVFHTDDIDFLQTINCPLFKISSFELLDLPLIRYAAKTKKSIVLSSGMASEEEIEAAWHATAGSPQTTVLKCTSSYPALSSDANLLTMRAWTRPRYAYDVGVSDHTLGVGVAVAAVALGAVMVEKHLTLSRADGGPDAGFSSEPAEFRQMVDACREAAAALGEVRYGPTPSEMSSLPLRRKPGGKRGG